MKEDDFYQQQPGYWERVVDGLGAWLGLHLTTLDVVILLPLFPLLPVVVTWWLPWERWLWKPLPRKIGGPYLLYCAFALWHFHARPWWILLVAIIGVGLCAMAYRDDRGKPWRRPQV
jgi:hypothetical protein